MIMKEDELILVELGKFGVKEINFEKVWRNIQRSCIEFKFIIFVKKNKKYVYILKIGREKKNS